MKRIVVILIVALALLSCSGKTKEELYAEGLKHVDAANLSGAVVLFKNALEKDENFIGARFQLARAYARLGKKDQAEKEFQKVLRQNPSSDEATLELAALFNADNKADEAFKLGESYLAHHPGSVEGLEILGISCAVKKNYVDAESYLLQALRADPSRSKTKVELAAVNIYAGNVKNAKALLEELIRTDTKSVRAYYMLGAIEADTGNRDKALEMYQKILQIDRSETHAAYKSGLIYIEKGDLDKAGKTAEDLAAQFPKRAEGLRLKGLVSYHRKNYAEALLPLQNSLKIMPTLEGYHFLGLCYYNLGELETALSQFRRILDQQPASRQARLMTGAILLSQKRTDDAINEIQRVLQIDDNDAVAHNLLGNAYMTKGMFDEGMREFNRATSIDPKIVDAYLKKGYFYFSRGKNVEGETELATAVKFAPDVQNSRMLLASYYLRQGNSPKALSVLRSGLTGKKSDAYLHNGIAAVLFSQNKVEDGLKCIHKAKEADPKFSASYQNLATYYAATGKYDAAVDEYVSLLRNDPLNFQAMLSLAVLYEIKGDERTALAYYQKAKESRQPAAFLAQAGYYLKKKENDKARKVLDEALSIDARNIPVLEMKGRILVDEKKYKDALRVFEEIETLNPDAGIAHKIFTYVAMKDTVRAVEQAQRIIEKSPGSAQGYMVLASVYEAQNDYTSAIREVRNGLRVDGKNVQAILNLGKLHEARKEYVQAMAAYTDACRIKPDFVPSLFAQGAILDLLGKKKEALEKYRAVLEKSDTYVPALNNLAYLCADGYGNKVEALRLAITAYKLEPRNAGVMDTLGYALLKNNRKEEAKKVLENASSLLPDDPTVNYHLGLTYKEVGDKSNAMRLLQKALSLGDFPDAPAARAILAELKH